MLLSAGSSCLSVWNLKSHRILAMLWQPPSAVSLIGDKSICGTNGVAVALSMLSSACEFVCTC